MKSNATRYVICYDVSNGKRRARLADCLDAYGDRVQESVFEAVLNRPLIDGLVRDALDIIDPEADRVTVYAICAACERRRVDLGLAANEPPPGTEDVFIV